MVEHVLAGAVGLGIDNCEVYVSRPELPGFDGSSMRIVDVLQCAQICTQPIARSPIVITHPLRVGDAGAWVEAHPHPCLRLEYELDYGSIAPIGHQKFSVDISPRSFHRELACARTFVTMEEAEWLRQQGLGQRDASRLAALWPRRTDW